MKWITCLFLMVLSTPILVLAAQVDVSVLVNNQYGGTLTNNEVTTTLVYQDGNGFPFTGNQAVNVHESVFPVFFHTRSEVKDGYTFSPSAGCSGVLTETDTSNCTITYQQQKPAILLPVASTTPNSEADQIAALEKLIQELLQILSILESQKHG